MFKVRAIWFVGLVAAMSGIALGGPQAIDRQNSMSFVGATPVACNGNAKVGYNCPAGCPTGTYHTIRAETPGATLLKRYENDTINGMQCWDINNESCTKYKMNEVPCGGLDD